MLALNDTYISTCPLREKYSHSETVGFQEVCKGSTSKCTCSKMLKMCLQAFEMRFKSRWSSRTRDWQLRHQVLEFSVL